MFHVGAISHSLDGGARDSVLRHVSGGNVRAARQSAQARHGGMAREPPVVRHQSALSHVPHVARPRHSDAGRLPRESGGGGVGLGATFLHFRQCHHRRHSLQGRMSLYRRPGRKQRFRRLHHFQNDQERLRP